MLLPEYHIETCDRCILYLCHKVTCLYVTCNYPQYVIRLFKILSKLPILASFEAKIAKICIFWTFRPVIGPIKGYFPTPDTAYFSSRTSDTRAKNWSTSGIQKSARHSTLFFQRVKNECKFEKGGP